MTHGDNIIVIIIQNTSLRRKTHVPTALIFFFLNYSIENPNPRRYVSNIFDRILILTSHTLLILRYDSRITCGILCGDNIIISVCFYLSVTNHTRRR